MMPQIVYLFSFRRFETMTKITLIFRFSLPEIVYPSVESFIVTKNDINIISSTRMKDEFLKDETELAKTINLFFDNGKLLPKEYWVPFWTSLLEIEKHNIFTCFFGNTEEFKVFENYISEQKFILNKIIYLKDK